MIKETYIQKLVTQYRNNQKVPAILARFIFHVLETSILKHYGQLRGDKCLQYSSGTHYLLKKMGINSRLLQVEVMAIESKIDIFGSYKSGGFNGENHHIVCMLSDFILKRHPISSKCTTGAAAT